MYAVVWWTYFQILLQWGFPLDCRFVRVVFLPPNTTEKSISSKDLNDFRNNLQSCLYVCVNSFKATEQGMYLNATHLNDHDLFLKNFSYLAQ